MKLACCGLDCQSCDAFVATEKNDDAMRAQTAQKWSAMYHADIKPEHINCTGCSGDGVKFFHCENSCGIRKCCNEKQIDNCASCQDYACESLREVFTFAPEAKNRLDALN